MTLSKSQKESLKSYQHDLVTKEDLMNGEHLFNSPIHDEIYNFIWRHDVPYCTGCKKFGGDLMGKCVHVRLKEMQEKEEQKMKVEPIKMGFMVDTDEAQHWIDAERFDLMGDWHRLFKGVKLVAIFHVKEVNYIKSAQQPTLIIGGMNVSGNTIR